MDSTIDCCISIIHQWSSRINHFLTENRIICCLYWVFTLFKLLRCNKYGNLTHIGFIKTYYKKQKQILCACYLLKEIKDKNLTNNVILSNCRKMFLLWTNSQCDLLCNGSFYELYEPFLIWWTLASPNHFDFSKITTKIHRNILIKEMMLACYW